MWKLHQECEKKKNATREIKIYERRDCTCSQTSHHCRISPMESLLQLNHKIKHAANIFFAIIIIKKKKRTNK